MMKLITVEKAKDEIQRLQHYVDLVESYEASTIERQIIKEYAYTNSIQEVVVRFKERGATLNGDPISKEYVTSVIKGKPSDELHKELRQGYMLRTKHTRTRKSNATSYFS